MKKEILEKEFNDMKFIGCQVSGVTFGDLGVWNSNMTIHFDYIYKDDFINNERIIKTVPAKMTFFGVSCLSICLTTTKNIEDSPIGCIIDVLWENLKIEKTSYYNEERYSWKFMFSNEKSSLRFNSRGFEIDIPDGFYNA